MYQIESDVFISNGADSLVHNTADLRRLMEYVLDQVVLVATFVSSTY